MTPKCPSCETEGSLRPGTVTQSFPYPNEDEPEGVIYLHAESDVECCISCGYCSVAPVMLWNERGRRIITHLQNLPYPSPELFDQLDKLIT